MDYKKIWEEFAHRWIAVVTRPEEFFTSWDPAESWKEVLQFNLICGLIGGGLTVLFTIFTDIGAILRYPIFVFAGTVVGGIVLFVCFKLLDGTGGVESTIKMVGYTQAVRAVYIGLPFIGFTLSFFAGIYQVWLLTVGGKALHGLDTVKSATAVLLPVAIIGLLTLIVSVFLGIGMMSYMVHGGAG